MPGVNPGANSMQYAAAPSVLPYAAMFADLDPHHIAQTIFRAVSKTFSDCLFRIL